MLYKWPQGRILRIIMLIAVLLITWDLGWSGYGQYSAWATADEPDTSNLIYMGLLGTMSAVAFFVGLAMVGFVPRTAQFLIEVEQEMAKVNWPSRADLIRSTILIAILAVVLALLIVVIDLFNNKLIYEWILGESRSDD